MNGAQEHVGDLIASFQVSLVVGSWAFKKKTPHKKTYTFAFILLQGILYSGFHISGILLIVWTGKGHQVSFGGRNNWFLARLKEKKRAVGQNDGARRLID